MTVNASVTVSSGTPMARRASGPPALNHCRKTTTSTISSRAQEARLPAAKNTMSIASDSAAAE